MIKKAYKKPFFIYNVYGDKMNGLLLINKPQGITSHDCLMKLKRRLGIKRLGHTGTLDPFATGLLIVLVGEATKLLFMFENLDKSYEGIMVFGKDYDTLDVTGKVIQEKEVKINENLIKEAMHSFIPSYDQIPPQYSAIKKDGMKAYEMARLGLKIELEPRRVQIYDFKMIDFNGKLTFETHVSKGTYIRSLARDLGYKLNTYGALEKLNRLSIGKYQLKDAKNIEEVTMNDLITDEKLFDNIRRIKLNDYMIRLVKNGVQLDHRQTTEKDPFVVINHNNEMIAYYELDGDKFKPKYFFGKGKSL